MVNAGVYLLVRFYPAFEGVPGWRIAVMLVGMVTTFLAAVMALVSNDLKRVLAYSTVSQLGYMVYAVGAGGVYASQFHLLSHSIFKALLFLAAGSIIHSTGTRDMREMGGLGRQMPLVSGCLYYRFAGTGRYSRSLTVFGARNWCWRPAWLEDRSGYMGSWCFSAGLTALYTFRCVWLVFYGEPRSRTARA